MNFLKLKPGEGVCRGLAIVFGLLAGYVDLHSEGAQLPVLLLISFSCLLGLAQPGGAWRWGLIVGAGVPCAHLLGILLGYIPLFTTDVTAVLLPLGPALLGAYAGAFVGRLAE